MNYAIKSVLNFTQTESFPYKCFTEKTPSGQHACLPGKKYGSGLIFKSLCPDCRRVRVDGIETTCLATILSKHHYWKPSLFRLLCVGVFLTAFWGLIGFSFYHGLKTFLPHHIKHAIRMKLNVILPQKNQNVAEDISEKDRQKSITFLDSANALMKLDNPQEAILEYRNSIKHNPLNSSAFFGLGECLLKTKRNHEAIDAFKHCVKLDNRNWKALRQLSVLYARYGQFEQARKHAEQLLSIKPNSADAHLVMAACLNRNGNIATALEKIDEAQKLLAISPEAYRIDSYLFAAQLCYQMKEYTTSETMYRQALKFDNNLVDARISLATLAGIKANFKQAEAELDKVFRQDPTSTNALLCRAEINVLEGKVQEAMKTLEKAAEIAPENDKIAIRQAELLIGSGNSNEGYKKLQRIMTRSPKNARALVVLANMYISKKLYAQAIEYAEAALKVDPKNGQASMALIKARLAQMEYEEAIDLIETTLKMYPKNFDLILLSAMAHHKLGKKTKATELFLEAAEIKPTSITPYINLGGIYYENNELELAVSNYKKVLEISPDHPIASNNLAMLLLKSQDGLEQALLLAKQLKKRYPENPFIDDTLGWAYYHAGDYEKALELLTAASNRRSNSPTIQFHLAMTLFKHGNIDGAHQALLDAFAIAKEFPEAAEAEKLLIRLERDE